MPRDITISQLAADLCVLCTRSANSQLLYAPNCTCHKAPFFSTLSDTGYTMVSKVNDNDIVGFLNLSVSDRDFIISVGEMEVNDTDNLSSRSVDEIDVNNVNSECVFDIVAIL